MANPYFHFKKFSIWQERAAMKVSTDACIQAAWTSSILDKICPTVAPQVLDIGAGTGLLSLMLVSEHSQLEIIALEPNEEAFFDLKRNIEDNGLEEKIQAKPLSIQDFNCPNKFDLIICNPPFFEKNLNAEKQSRNQARHDISLNKAELAAQLSTRLHQEGSACIMYPESEWNRWIAQAATQHLHLKYQLQVRPDKNKPANRIIGIFGLSPAENIEDQTLIIYDEHHQYTEEFAQLLRPYYLKL